MPPASARCHVTIDRHQQMGAALFPCDAVLLARCDEIPTPAENPLYPYSGHSCAHRRPHDSGKLFVDGR
jgi:hypothetical protein